jgi:glycosyltransferase involved in cell wall biosynthesis
MFSLCITTYNRFGDAFSIFKNNYSNDLIAEVVISDECSGDYKGFESYQHFKKLSLRTNPENLGALRNKIEAVKAAKNPWVMLIDSDNMIDEDYITACYFTDMKPDTIYAPVKGLPNLDYSEFSGRVFTKEDLPMLHRGGTFESLLNTCNYFFNRNEFLDLASQIDLQTNWKSYESLYFAVMWLKSGRKIEVVPSLEYKHNTESPDGVYRRYAHESGPLKTKILELCS